MLADQDGLTGTGISVREGQEERGKEVVVMVVEWIMKLRIVGGEVEEPVLLALAISISTMWMICSKRV